MTGREQGDGHGEIRSACRHSNASCPNSTVGSDVAVRVFQVDRLCGRGDVYVSRQGLPAPAVFAVLAIIIEIGGGLLILFGYQTRLVALGCAIYILVAALIAHRNFSDGNQLAHFMKNLAITGGFLALMIAGPGRFSLDARKS